MGLTSNLVVLSLVAASVLGLPHPDEYNIPAVGNNRRSQYYVLHDDGSHKYGYDTGENAFESLKTHSDGEVDGKFGYTDSDGQEFRVQYTSGTGGFVAQGDHIPQVHPDVAAAFAAARAAGPFEDPLADAEGDRSFDFEFDGEEYSRNEVSDSDGTVTGSYSYIDEFGRTRTYTYRAGKGIGFQIVGDDIPQPVQPLASHTAIANARATQSSSARFGASSSPSTSTRVSHNQASTRTNVGSATNTRFSHGSVKKTPTFSSTRQQQGHSVRQQTYQAPTNTYFPPAAQSSAKPASFSANRRNQQSTASQRFASQVRTATGASAGTRQFEAANTRTSFSPSGSYSLAYETSSHSRQEAGDDDNTVRGQFTFRADDDGEERSVIYRSGAETGFTAQGAHLPIGPSVPGASSGQVTGILEKVQEVKFIDPLADDDLDPSYNFGFDSETYSRSETADEDGNVVGTYSVLGEDNILRTYRFRAGKGIGYEVEEISATPGRSSATSTSRQQSTNFRTGAASTSGVSASNTKAAFGSTAGVKSSLSHGSSAGHTSSFQTPSRQTYQAPQHSAHASRASAQSSFSANTRSSSARTGQSSKFGFNRDASDSEEDFTLHQYDASEGRGKYGYVLKFD